MRTFGYIGLALLTGLVLPGTLTAQPPVAAPVPAPAPAAPPTIWNLLGIPQAIQKHCDAKVNHNGCRPCAERTDPLKRLADPANLESPNPAIKTAAKIKQDQDLAPQKIKAIKYLGCVGCGCYPGVKEALVAALDDCTEAVRYEAALALCRASGNPCNRCENRGCCNAAVMNKLQDIAFGLDDKGCFKEPSAEVRAAAQNALSACKRMHPAGPGPVPTTLPDGETPRVPTRAPGESPRINSLTPPRANDIVPQPGQSTLESSPIKERSPMESVVPHKATPAPVAPAIPAETPAEKPDGKPPVAPMPPATNPAAEQSSAPIDSVNQVSLKVNQVSFNSVPGTATSSPLAVAQPKAAGSASGNVVLSLVVSEHRDPPGSRTKVVSDESAPAELPDARISARRAVEVP